MATAVLCEDLTHDYGDRRALDSVGLSVESGAIVGLLGPNGGGKTTLFKVLCTLLRPTSGRVQVLGVDALQDPARVRSRIGVVFQHPSVDPNLTVNENLMHQGHLYGMKGRQLRERMGEVLELLHLTNRRVDRVSTLSGLQVAHKCRYALPSAAPTCQDDVALEEGNLPTGPGRSAG